MKSIHYNFLMILCAVFTAQVSAFFPSDDPGASIMGGTATGALIGGAAGGGRGAAIGAGVGFGLGAMSAAARSGDRGYYRERRGYIGRHRDRRSLREQLNDCMQENEQLRQENSQLMQQLQSQGPMQGQPPMGQPYPQPPIR